MPRIPEKQVRLRREIAPWRFAAVVFGMAFVILLIVPIGRVLSPAALIMALVCVFVIWRRRARPTPPLSPQPAAKPKAGPPPLRAPIGPGSQSSLKQATKRNEQRKRLIQRTRAALESERRLAAMDFRNRGGSSGFHG